MRLLPAALAAALAVLAGCTKPAPPPLPPNAPAGTPAWNVPTGPGPAMTAVEFDHLPGWTRDNAAEALPGFLANCVQILASPSQGLGGSLEAGLRGGNPEQWRRACEAARAVPPGNPAAARTFFEANFRPYGLSSDGSSVGLFTGYYEPELRGSRTQSRTYDVPLYRRPPGLVAGGRAIFTRAQIENGALRRKRLELLWLDDPIDAFFLQIQGAGRVILPDGGVVRVSYDGQNGQSYVPIGRVLVDRGEMTLEQVSMQTIKAWLKANPRQARTVMDQNPSYVFFRELAGIPPDQGPPGTFGVRLAPMRSVAVDKTYIPLGAPVWIDTEDPLDGSKLQRLMMAQDLGGAIRGPIRTDIFFGWGQAAEERAGRMRGKGTEYVLLPR
jgi:membrane-bound lytic murein transglycosylase A